MDINGYHVLVRGSANCIESKAVDRMLQRSEARVELLKKKKLAGSGDSFIIEKTEYFNSVFQSLRRDIQQKLLLSRNIKKESLSCHFDEISKDFQKLQKLLSDNILFMPTYEIKMAQERINLLNEEIQEAQDALLPKKKFTFRSKKKVHNDACDSPISDHGNGLHYLIEPNKNVIEKLDNMIISKCSEDVDRKDISLSLLKNCTINIFGAPSTLFISELSDCHIFCGPVSTSIHIENCNNCTFSLACQQLRIHGTVDCILYTHITSRTIIEDCSSLQFAPYNWTYSDQEKDFATSGLDRNHNNWNSVDDFNWLVSGVPSPNWSVLSEE